VTQEEQDAILGRTLREYNDCCKELAAIATKMARAGQELALLGRRLKMQPEMVMFEGVAHDARFGNQISPSPEDNYVFSSAAIDGKSIVAQVTSLQNQHIKKSDLVRQLKSLGHDVSKFGD
jgi:hypothetical protein